MRIRDFKWSTDVFGPLFGIFLLLWGALGDALGIALVGGYLFVVMSFWALGRLERMQPDGSYTHVLSQEWSRWVGRPTNIVVGLVFGIVLLPALLFFLGLPIYLAVPAGLGLAVGCALAAAWVRDFRPRRQK